jgi:uncharacterized protein involved in copper resistance
MRSLTLAAFTAGMLLDLAGVATAQQQNGPTQNMPAMDHANMQGMQGMDNSKMPMNMQGMDHSNVPGMQGNRQAGQGTLTPAPTRSARPGAAPQ